MACRTEPWPITTAVPSTGKGTGHMEIIPYSEWCDVPPRGVPSEIATGQPRAWLHHGAAGTSSISTMRPYAKYHIETRGWLAIGYSWGIAEGKVLECRGAGRAGAHTRGDNFDSYGIVVAGNYTDDLPSQEDLDALIWLLRHGASQGWWPTPTLTGGHRDAPGAFTSCPGDALHGHIPHINRLAASPRLQVKEDDVALTSGQERALAMIPKLAADVDTIKSRIPANTADELDRLRVGVRMLAQQAGVDLGDEGP